MCGIMGYYSFSNTLPDKNELALMFGLLESRGRDASGYAFLRGGELVVHKQAIKSSLLVKTREWEELELPDYMIMHTRMKTQGSEKNNANNHPLFSKAGLAIVHNGIIYNDKEIFGKKERDAQVDSEAILHFLSKKVKGDILDKLFQRVMGSFAVAVIDKNVPGHLILIKKDNPIDLYYDAEKDIMYFCSEREIMQEALGVKKATIRGFNVGEGHFHYYEMNNNHHLVINQTGVEDYTKHYAPNRWETKWSSTKKDYSYSRYDTDYDDYKRTAALAKEVDEVEVECPYCYSITMYDFNSKINRCKACSNIIVEEEVY